jgi:hypothetical protein
MSDALAFLVTAPNEPLARFWEQILIDAGIPVLVRPGGPGAGGWGSVATFAHDLYVRRDDLHRAREIMKDDLDDLDNVEHDDLAEP